LIVELKPVLAVSIFVIESLGIGGHELGNDDGLGDQRRGDPKESEGKKRKWIGKHLEMGADQRV
ncbi:hypothetical protein N9142_04320, partial [Akkermansiaceae bacterium]|nr:hypothetical protein [Akkermansiaceae bacterium]